MSHICIDGSVPPEKRQGLVNRFQMDAGVTVALLSIKAAGVGLTLTVSCTASPSLYIACSTILSCRQLVTSQ